MGANTPGLVRTSRRRMQNISGKKRMRNQSNVTKAIRAIYRNSYNRKFISGPTFFSTHTKYSIFC